MIECVPNFSESKHEATLDALEAAIRSSKGALLLGRESDADHNRSVFTIVGSPEAVLEAAVRAAVVAAERIDLTTHHGVHPRIGAADVIPLIPLGATPMEDCVALAHRAAEEIWQRAHVPSYFYEFAAPSQGRTNLEAIRKIGFERLRHLTTAYPPDVGGPHLHPTAGACAIGARRILIACNVNLEAGLAAAKQIARHIRASSGGFPYVKALGLDLPTRHLAQVSMNLTHYEVTPLAQVFDRIRELGGKVHSTEIIGFPPLTALENAQDFLALCEHWSDARILENRIAELSREAQFTGDHAQSAD